MRSSLLRVCSVARSLNCLNDVFNAHNRLDNVGLTLPPT